jgi:hypothetical protein
MTRNKGYALNDALSFYQQRLEHEIAEDGSLA